MQGRVTNEVLFLEIQNLSKNFDEYKVCQEKDLQEYRLAQDKRISNLETEVKFTRDWRLTFVAKFSVYSSIAVFIGTLVGTLIVKYADKIFNL